MKITTRPPSVTIERIVELDGASVQPTYSERRKYQPHLAVITYRYYPKIRKWEARASDVQLHGHVLKKDGTPGAQIYRESASYNYRSGRFVLPEIQALVDLLRPHGAPYAVSLDQYELET